MPRGSWRLFVAIGAFAGLALLGQAQEGEEQPQRPATEKEVSANDFPVPLPIVVIEPEEAAVARQHAEEESRDREERDLIAQEGMNTQTKRMANYAVKQTFLILIGTIALIWTLIETRAMLREARATTKAAVDGAEAAWESTRVAKDVAARQSRCYIEPVGATFIKPDPEKATLLTSSSSIKLKCTNHGESIGREIYCLYEVEIIALDKGTGTLGWREFQPEFKSDHPNVAPKSDFSISLDLNAVRQIESIPFDGNSLAIIRGAVYYRDVFDEQFRSGFVLLGLIPFNAPTDALEIPFGMKPSSESRPVFELVKPA